jgi:hypothetical protein
VNNTLFQRLNDKLYVSSDLRSDEAAQFLATTSQFHLVCNAITSIISPTLYSAGLSAIGQIQRGSVLAVHHPCVDRWTSVWTGISIIVNRATPMHRDWGAAPPFYDLLVSGGTHADCHLNLPDLGTRLWYLPGTAVAVSGRVLRHEVPDWLEGERICCAHFIKDAVHDRLGEARPVWPCLTDYFTLIDT